MTEPCPGCPETSAILPDAMIDAMADIYQFPNDNQLQEIEQVIPPYVGRKFLRPIVSADGSIEYPKLSSHTTPPRDLKGYERDPTNPWRFVPEWNTCQARGMGVKVEDDGCIQVRGFCHQPKAKQYAQLVTPADCKNCPVRQP